MSVLLNIEKLNFNKLNGVVPAVVQDHSTLRVLKVGFMNREAVKRTSETGRVAFFCPAENRLVTDEEQDRFLEVNAILADCDGSALLIKAIPHGPVCHSGNGTCFGENNKDEEIRFLSYLQDFIDKRRQEMPAGSYTTSLFEKGTAKIAQKVGEEAVETIIGAMADDNENFVYEAADLLYHLTVLLSYKGFRLEDVAAELKKRHKLPPA